jgi:uncharacterized repeat protein (TIGR03803 family)
MNAEMFARRIATSSPRRFALAAPLCCLAAVLSAVQAPVAHGQTYTLLHSFNATDGMDPEGSLTSGGSLLYGMTSAGGSGSSGFGTIFSISSSGTGFQSLFTFNGTNGSQPLGSLTLSGSMLYGMTEGGGIGWGNIFSINTSGTGIQNLHSFNGTDEAFPYGSLTASGSSLYGMTESGGGIFSINTSGAGFHELYSFSGADGASPQGSLLLSGSALYGTTSSGGTGGGMGTIFSASTSGSGLQNLHSFNGTDGWAPCGSLTLVGSTLYGTTEYGGGNNEGTIFSINTDGSGFRDLLSFNGTNGANPMGDLTLVGSTLFGMTCHGGMSGLGFGTIFSINTDGSGFQDLLSFNNTNGAYPYGDLTLSGSTLYGMTQNGGSTGSGVIFSFTVPEPSTLALLGGGALGMLVYRRWRRRR